MLDGFVPEGMRGTGEVLEMGMKDADGISLTSNTHPRTSWVGRIWFALRRPRLCPDSLETMQIDPTVSLNAGPLFNGAFSVDDKEIEKEIQAKGLTAPRVTLAHVESCIAYEYYITGDQLPDIAIAVLGVACPQVPTMLDTTTLSSLTLCVLVLKNGFTATGENACASQENYNAELGRKIARQKAVDKVWMLEGYRLKERLHAAAQFKPMLG